MVSQLGGPADSRAWAETANAFYRRHRPRAHFRTASRSPLFAAAVAALLHEHRVRTVVELGAGDGILLSGLRPRRPELTLIGIDLANRPPDLDPTIDWTVDRWDPAVGGWVAGAANRVLAASHGPIAVLCCEFLDDLPSAADHSAAWRWVISALRRTGGIGLLVDYVRHRDDEAAPRAYAYGRPVEPRAAADRNLTRPIDLDAIESIGTRAGATTLGKLSQAAALRRWAPLSTRTGSDGAVSAEVLEPADGADPDPLGRLVGRSQRHALSDPYWLGAHRWLVQSLPTPRPLP